MKRLLTIGLTLVVVLAALTGCMSPNTYSRFKKDQNLLKEKRELQPLDLPVPDAGNDLKINSLDKLNYFAALRTIMETPTVSKQSTTGGSFDIVFLANGAGQDKKEVPPTPETTGSDVTVVPSVTPKVPDNTDSGENIYYYELDPNEPFFINKVSMFRIELTDESGFLASRLGLGLVDVVITEDCIWGDSLITFRNGEKFFSCLSNGWGMNGETGGWQWNFSTHKYVEGFNIVKNFEQENYGFYIDMDALGQAFSFECRESQNGGNRPDQNVKVVSSTGVSNRGSRYTIAELEKFFNNDSIVQ